MLRSNISERSGVRHYCATRKLHQLYSDSYCFCCCSCCPCVPVWSCACFRTMLRMRSLLRWQTRSPFAHGTHALHETMQLPQTRGLPTYGL